MLRNPTAVPLADAGPTIGMIITPATPNECAICPISKARPYPGPIPGTTNASPAAASINVPTMASYSAKVTSYAKPVPQAGMMKSTPRSHR